MDLSLGVSMTATSVRLALVDVGNDDGMTVDSDEFAIPEAGNIAVPSQTESVVTAVLGTSAIAAAGGHNLVSIGVTWHEGADSDAESMLKTLTDLGFRNLVPVSAPEAVEVLTATIARAAEFETFVNCIVEPEAVLQCLVQLGDEDVRQSHVRVLDGGQPDEIVGWLTAGLNDMDVEPDAVVVLGSDVDTEKLSKAMAAAAKRPVITTPQCELAMARGAAFAAVRRISSVQTTPDVTDRQPKPVVFVSRAAKIAAMPELTEAVEPTPSAGPRPLSNIGAVSATLAVAVLTFAVSAFVLMTGGANPEPAKGEHRQVIETLVGSAKPAPPAELPPPAAPLAPPPPEASPVVQAALPPQTQQLPAPVQPSVPQQTAGQPNQAVVDGMVRSMQEWWLAQQPPPEPDPNEPPPPLFPPAG